ncbi:CU044_5270 family protein [Actinomadura alba]|uniref:CU044_5270 family protein n=1 Tax=Actinomadura alba TaxID=406431 RepID=A0ABR7LMF3_9ACTN|nr:CU044_5270 family protein [Actinomadura alba]MBC6466011.1 CU044_5270 family protein [Actinomadura alba]
MDDLQQVRDRHDALPDPAPETITQARARLTAHMRQVPSRKRSWRPAWRLGLAGAAATALLAAAVAVGVGTGGDRPGGQPPAQLRPVANAQDLASNAAIKAAAQHDPMPKPHQWAYSKTLSAQTNEDGGDWLRGTPKVKHTWEMWHRIDDWGFADYPDGKLKLHKGSERRVSYQDIFSLPQDPDALLAEVYKRVTAGGTREPLPGAGSGITKPGAMGDEERNMYAFFYIHASMWDTVLPAKLRAAMYGALAKIPGVGYEARAVDLAKRPGVTFYRLQNGYQRDEIFIDPNTYEYLGARSIVVKDHKEMGVNVKKGDIISWASLLKAVIVDRPGQRP